MAKNTAIATVSTANASIDRSTHPAVINFGNI